MCECVCARVLQIAGHCQWCITELRSHNKDAQRRFEMALNLDDQGGIPALDVSKSFEWESNKNHVLIQMCVFGDDIWCLEALYIVRFRFSEVTLANPTYKSVFAPCPIPQQAFGCGRLADTPTDATRSSQFSHATRSSQFLLSIMPMYGAWLIEVAVSKYWGSLWFI